MMDSIYPTLILMIDSYNNPLSYNYLSRTLARMLLTFTGGGTVVASLFIYLFVLDFVCDM